MPLSKSDPRPAAVYRWFAYTGQLAYVGCSTDPERRMEQYQWEHPWLKRVVARRTIDWYESVGLALQAETDAIKTESPLFNINLARRSRWKPVVRWLDPDGPDPVPCLYGGNSEWMIGHEEIRSVLARNPDTEWLREAQRVYGDGRPAHLLPS